MTYPPGWPKCPNCGEPALDGHITCGRFECNEHETRQERAKGRPEFSVVQFFPDGNYEYVCRYVHAAEAMPTFKRLTESVGARIGTTVRVIVTDGGDYTNAEWKFGEGYTYPPELVALTKDRTA